MQEKECPFCGTKIPIDASKCYSCKNWVEDVDVDIDDEYEYEDDDAVETDRPVEFIPTLLFAYFLGMFGIHRFYTGHITTVILQLFTLGWLGIWTYIDFVLLCFNKFKDSQNRELRNYDKNLAIVLFVISLIPILLMVLLFALFFCIFMISFKQGF